MAADPPLPAPPPTLRSAQRAALSPTGCRALSATDGAPLFSSAMSAHRRACTPALPLRACTLLRPSWFPSARPAAPGPPTY
eukprot:scaffold24790_cov53-Phaeocystis_antarctica.AAC.3